MISDVPSLRTGKTRC